jgi:nucleoside-triphosphatase THEP1
MVKNLLITGRPGVGKTTLVQRVVDRLHGWTLAGFTSGELRDVRGGRVGFEIVTLDGRRGRLAHVDQPSGPQVAHTAGPRVGRYRVDLPAFEALALPAISPPPGADLVVIDEIGKMECFSRGFREQVLRLLDGAVPVLATIGLHGDAYMQGIKARPDVEVLAVTEATRDALVETLIARLHALKGCND